MQMMEGDEFRQRRKLLTPMMGRGQLTKIATTVGRSGRLRIANRLARWDRFADIGERMISSTKSTAW